jgi:hypothetical protein
MILLKPNGRIDLEHRAYFLRNAPGQSAIIAADKEGRYSIVSADFGESRSYRRSSTLRTISPHPVAPWLALVDNDSGSLIVQTLDGDRLVQISPSQVGGTAPNWIKQGFGDCLFDDGGEFLWLVAPRSAEDIAVCLIETTNWSFVDNVIIHDPFGGSSCSFHDTGRPGLMVLWLAAGQDGQQVYWLNRSHNNVSCDREPRLENTCPPIFSPNKEEILVINEKSAICKYSLPSMNLVAPPLESGDDDDPFAESLVYLTERQALAGTNEGRMFMVDTARMRIEDEVAVGEHSPSSTKEQELGASIAWFTGVGDVVVFICRRDRGTGLQGWKDSLLCYSAVKG